MQTEIYAHAYIRRDVHAKTDIHTYIHTYTHAYIHTYIHTQTYRQMEVYKPLNRQIETSFPERYQKRELK